METRRRTPGRGAPPGLRFRATAAIGCICVALLALTGRLAHLQIVEHDRYRDLARQQQMTDRKLSARRGDIYDRNGRCLASSVRCDSVFADPALVEAPPAVAAALSRALGVPAADLARRLARERRFVWLMRHVSNGEAAKVRELALKGVYLRQEYRRLYPQGKLGAHVVGFTDIDGHGLAGIELQMDDLLRGRPGLETVQCDGGRRVIRARRQRVRTDPFDGHDMYLTLDLCVQIIVEEELDAAVEEHEPEAAAAIVMDARDGSVLAMACRPTFDPQAPADYSSAQRRNIAVTDAYEFGSVVKPVGISLAVEAGVVGLDSEFDCHKGAWRVGRRVVHDVHPYGVLTVRDILIHSSNIGAAQVCMELGVDALYAGVCRFGWSAPTGIALPGEAGGILQPRRAWNRHSVISVAFGQEVAVTPLAVARAFALFASGGALLQPRIVDRIEHAGTGEIVYEAGEAVVNARPLSPETAGHILEVLRMVVEEGTGRRARLQGYPVAGKTGTAQLLRKDGRGYAPDRYLSSFAAIAPVPDARIVVLVMLKAPERGGHYGGTVAAPAARNIVRRTLTYLDVPRQEPVRLAEGGSS